MCGIEWFYRKEDIYLILKGQRKIKLSEKGMYQLVFCYNETRSLIKTWLLVLKAQGHCLSSGECLVIDELSRSISEM